MTNFPHASPNEIETFKEEIEAHMKEINTHIDLLSDESARDFVTNLCEFYANRDYLTNKQLAYLVPQWHIIREKIT